MYTLFGVYDYKNNKKNLKLNKKWLLMYPL